MDTWIFAILVLQPLAIQNQKVETKLLSIFKLLNVYFLFFFASQLYQDMRDLFDTMSRLSMLPAEYEGKEKVNQW